MTHESETSHPLDQNRHIWTHAAWGGAGDEQSSQARGHRTSSAPSLRHVPRSVQVQRKATKTQGFSQAPSWRKGEPGGNNPQAWSSGNT